MSVPPPPSLTLPPQKPPAPPWPVADDDSVSDACTGDCLAQFVCNLRASVSTETCASVGSIFKRDVVRAREATGHAHSHCGVDVEGVLDGLRAAREEGKLGDGVA